MAGLFSVPKPVVIQPPAPPPSPQQTAAAAASTTATAQAAEAARVENRARARNGVDGTIATSARGVLTSTPFAVTRKSLLGE
ncbi:MAG: hypothetical protein JWR10_2105 [Rubritepida sp.]|nr:hypothetical protein [Rubritepida sp.]